MKYPCGGCNGNGVVFGGVTCSRCQGSGTDPYQKKGGR